MEDIARPGIGARPDGDRKHHDIARRKSCDRERPYEFAQGAVFAVAAEIVKVGFESRIVQCLDERRRRIASPGDGDAPGRQVDARPLDPRQTVQDALDPGDAAAAVDRGHAELVLSQAGCEHPARQEQFVARI